MKIFFCKNEKLANSCCELLFVERVERWPAKSSRELTPEKIFETILCIVSVKSVANDDCDSSTARNGLILSARRRVRLSIE